MKYELYDFDKTLYPHDSATMFYLFCLKRHPKILKYLPKQIFSAVKFFMKKETLTEFKGDFFCFVKSIDAQKEAEKFWEKNEDRIFDYIKDRDKNLKMAVCSASPEFEIRPILEKIGADVIIGSAADVKTGKFLSENCKGEEKVRRIKEKLPDAQFVNAYTDNPKSDKPLLSLAENKFLIKNGEKIKLN